ncbi:hypothetical protein GOP47_0014809 [Adiantum capillus-veneris]|uniref:GEX2 N-terminal Ig-like domain-containing protein n=1 Tax=Adiantum capillus-veneris TaxID=13818 RepID=A0A9D4ZF64_ADICA|nr:hypothetical protein GOP47_0014809 [Adiantum capillus-veneris]
MEEWRRNVSFFKYHERRFVRSEDSRCWSRERLSDWLKICQLLLFLILAGLGLRGFPGLSEAVSLSYECSYFTEHIRTVTPWNYFNIKIALVGDCQQNCGLCQPYVDDVGQLSAVLIPDWAKVFCKWQRSPAGSNFYLGTCGLDHPLSPSTNRIYFVTLIVPTTKRNIVHVTYFSYLSGDLYPLNCGPLDWTSYTARSLQAGKQAAFKVPLKDIFGFVKKSSTGAVPSADVKSFSSAINLSFAKQISNVSIQYSETEGFLLVSFIPITCGTWTARAGIEGWTGKPTPEATFKGSPFELRISAGDLWVEECTAEWLVMLYTAGKSSRLRVYLRDRYGNALVGNTKIIKFNIYTYAKSGGVVYEEASYSLQSDMPQIEYVTFTSNKAGVFSYYVSYGSKQVKGSPFKLTRLPALHPK